MANNDVLVRILGENSSAIKALEQVQLHLETTKGVAEGAFQTMEKAGLHSALAIGAVFGGAGLIIAKSIKAVADSEATWNTLDAQLQNVGSSYADVKDRVDELAEHTHAFTRFSEIDTGRALTNLVGQTGNVDKAMKGTSLVFDLMIAKHLDLDAASKIVGKALNNQTTGFARLGITIKDGIPVFDQLQQRFGGIAEKDAKSLEAQMERVKISMEELFKSIGGAIVGQDGAKPIKDIADAITHLAESIEENKDGLHALSTMFSWITVLPAQGWIEIFGLMAKAAGGYASLVPDRKSAAGLAANPAKDINFKPTGFNIDKFAPLVAPVGGGAPGPDLDEVARIAKGQLALFKVLEEHGDSTSAITTKLRDTYKQVQELLKTASDDADREKATGLAVNIEKALGIRDWEKIKEQAKKAHTELLAEAKKFQEEYNRIMKESGNFVRDFGIDTFKGKTPTFGGEHNFLKDIADLGEKRLRAEDKSRLNVYGETPEQHRARVQADADRAAAMDEASRVAKQFSDDLFNAFIHAAQGAHTLRDALKAFAISATESVGHQFLQRGIEKTGASLAGHFTSLAKLTGPESLGIGLAATIGATLVGNLFNKSAEDAMFRAHLRALREARDENNTTVNINLSGNVDFSSPDQKEMLINGINGAIGSRSNTRVNLVYN